MGRARELVADLHFKPGDSTDTYRLKLSELARILSGDERMEVEARRYESDLRKLGDE